jgi:Family of unknown function (DUF5317)
MTFFVAVLAVAVIVSLLRGGRLANLTEIYARGWWLLLVGFGMQIAAGVLHEGQRSTAVGLMLGSYLLLVIVVVLNRNEAGIWIAGIGILMNFTVIAFNNGMPVLEQAVELAGGSIDTIALDPKHVLLEAGVTRFAFLADIIPLPGTVISLGDVFLAIGLGVFVEDQLKQPVRLFRHRVQGIPGSAAES